MIWAKFDLPSMSFRTFMRSLERDADFWLTCVMPFAVFVKTVFRSIRIPRGVRVSVPDRQQTNNGMNSDPWKMYLKTFRAPVLHGRPRSVIRHADSGEIMRTALVSLTLAA